MSEDLPYTRRQIIETGKALAGRLEPCEATQEVFRIAHAWRSSYLEPMHRLRQQLAGGRALRPGR